MNYSDYISEPVDQPALVKTQSDGVTSYLAKYATNARFRLFRETSLRSISQSRPVIFLGRTLVPGKNLRERLSAEIEKLPWCTYRTHFRPIIRREEGQLPASYTSDQGWGCTLRVGQMVLLGAITRHLDIPYSQNRFMFASMICENLESSELSLHKILEAGRRYMGKTPGDWCSAGTVSHMLHYLIRENTFFRDFTVSVAMDGAVYRDEVLADIVKRPVNDLHCDCELNTVLCPSCAERLWRGSVLLLIPLMPGRQCIHPSYHPAIRFFLSQPQSIGMIGGMGRSAIYVVGYQEDQLLYIDPHYVQKASRDEEDLVKHLDTYQAHSVGLVKLEDAGSSIALAFWLDSYQSFQTLLNTIATQRSCHNGLLFVRDRGSEPVYEDAIEIP